MPRLKLVLAYQGTSYAGWQMQTRSGVRSTVQREIEICVERVVGERVPVHGAGRTDSGVHAERQVCHLDLPRNAARINWRQALNIQLPQDIRVTEAVWVDDAFHSRKSAIRKRYAYSLWMHRDKALPRIAPFVWSTPPLNLDLLDPVLPLLVGRRNFASFQNSGTRMSNTVRDLYSVTCHPGMVAELACPESWPVATLIFEGNGFLKQMVRNLAGLLVWTVLGKIRPEQIPDILAAENRSALPSPSAPAQGLTLLEVVYP